MHFLTHCNISEVKKADLKERLKRLPIDLNEIEESYALGSGRGGQKVQKTYNKVIFKHLPTGITASSSRERERNKNRFLALRSLVEKLEKHFNLVNPKKQKLIDSKRKQKKKRLKRSKEKHQSSGM